MSRRLNHLWRVFATGLSFSLFGLGGVLLGVLVLPLVALVTRDRELRVRRCRKVVHYAFRLFVGLMKHLGVLTYSVEGAEQLHSGGMLVVANHPTLIDIVFLVSLIPNATCIVREGLARNIFTRGPVGWAGYIANDSGEGLLDACVEELRRGSNLVVFPEGTRSVQGARLRFRRGAAYIWQRSACELVFATLRSDPPTLAKHASWYAVPERRFHYSMQLRDAGNPAVRAAIPDSADDPRQINRNWQNYFQQELAT